MEKYQLTKVVKVVPGGETGQDSIYAGIEAAHQITSDEKSVVLIHDGVRPLIEAKTITDCLERVKENGTAITVAPAIETIIRVNDEACISDVIERSSCLMARAPQCFYLNEIYQAHLKAREENRHDFIDSATLMKHYGHSLSVVQGPVENIKITTPMDYYTFKALSEARENLQLYGN